MSWGAHSGARPTGGLVLALVGVLLACAGPGCGSAPSRDKGGFVKLGAAGAAGSRPATGRKLLVAVGIGEYLQDGDCDGVVDEGCAGLCEPEPEICDDGVDNDCDGVVDEGCAGQCEPEPEICDGVDNDCDGVVDEDC